MLTLLAQDGTQVATIQDKNEIRNRRNLTMQCDQCEALMINGTFCHETGCPNTHSRYDADEDCWIAQRKCFTCGCLVDADDPCCLVEEQDLEEVDGLEF